MRDDGTNWEALVEKRLAEARRERQAEVQSAQPAPGPEAAARVVERFREASGAGEAGSAPAVQGGGEPQPVLPADAPPRQRGLVRPPMSARERRASERHLHGFSWRRAKRTVFLLLLVALFIGGLCLTFSPQIKQILGFLRPDRDSAGDGLILPADPAAPKAPPARPPAEPPAALGTAPDEGAGKSRPPILPADPGPEKKPSVPAGREPPPVPAETKPEAKPEEKPKPEVKPKEEEKPVVPLERAKPVDPSTMPVPPKPPEPPRLPSLPKGPWDTQGLEKPRPVDPRDSLG
ncbi:MAG TPA: hypothetical protein PK280_09080 [Planctomycetota bacterium]|nr:hypothetical protein [Planctomycetota bacterium]